MMAEVNIKECFVSRYEGGYIIEADFSQLEVVGTAIVSGDPMMKRDIRAGIDSHSQSAAWLNPQHTYDEIREGYLAEDPYYTKLRKNAKAPRFELQYGAGASSIARNNGLSREAAQGFIDRYYDRYSTLKDFQDGLKHYVEGHLKPSQYRTKSGYPLRVGKWKSDTGRIYTFIEQESPQFMQEKGIPTSISPTQIANYPMQGFSTADVMGVILGKLMRALLANDKYKECLLINTVHDSILFDCPAYLLDDAVTLIRSTMTAAPRYMKEIFGIDFDLPIGVDIEVGHNWANMKNYYEV